MSTKKLDKSQPLPHYEARNRALTMRQIEVFHAIMTSGTLNGAALALNVSQPALSRTLALCESRLGYLLFERLGRRLQPTPEARRLHEEARDVYRGLDRLNAVAQRIGSAGVDTLHIATSATFSTTLIPTALQQFTQRNPQSRIDFRTATYDELPDYLLSDQADVGVSLVQAYHPGLKSKLLGKQPLVCVLPPAHPLSNHHTITPSELSQSSWIGYPPDTPLGRICIAELGIDISSANIQVRSPTLALSCAQMGLGAAIVDASCISMPMFNNLIVRPLAGNAMSEIWAVTSALHPLSDVAQQFIEALQKVITESASK